MYENNLQAAQVAVGGSLIGEFRQPSFTEQMRQRKQKLEAELAEVDNVLRRLEANPEAAELLDSISRLGGLRY